MSKDKLSFSVDVEEALKLGKDYKGGDVMGLLRHIESKTSPPPLLQEGDIIELRAGHKVYMWLPEHFSRGHRGRFSEMANATITIGEIHNDLDTKFLIGKYIVVKTSMEGGSGPNALPGQDYPDGHHVFCQHVDYPDVKVNFYQTGCFTAQTRDIPVIARAKATWTVEEVKVKGWKA